MYRGLFLCLCWVRFLWAMEYPVTFINFNPISRLIAELINVFTPDINRHVVNYLKSLNVMKDVELAHYTIIVVWARLRGDLSPSLHRSSDRQGQEVRQPEEGNEVDIIGCLLTFTTSYSGTFSQWIFVVIRTRLLLCSRFLIFRIWSCSHNPTSYLKKKIHSKVKRPRKYIKW